LVGYKCHSGTRPKRIARPTEKNYQGNPLRPHNNGLAGRNHCTRRLLQR